ncbi:unnamed protein product [Caenorhabditis brenneri]
MLFIWRDPIRLSKHSLQGSNKTDMLDRWICTQRSISEPATQQFQLQATAFRLTRQNNTKPQPPKMISAFKGVPADDNSNCHGAINIVNLEGKSIACSIGLIRKARIRWHQWSRRSGCNAPEEAIQRLPTRKTVDVDWESIFHTRLDLC